MQKGFGQEKLCADYIFMAMAQASAAFTGGKGQNIATY